MASAAVCSEAVVLLLYMHCSLLLPMFVESLFSFAVPCVLSVFAIIPLGKRELVGLHLLCSECRVAVVVLCLFLAVPWVGGV